MKKQTFNKIDLVTYIKDLFSSEIDYFAAASRCESLGIASLTHMEGFESLAAGSVVQGIVDNEIKKIDKCWLSKIEQRLLALHIFQARIYLGKEYIAVSRLLSSCGYKPKVEIGLLCEANTKTDPEIANNNIRLAPIIDEKGWLEKKRIYDHIEMGPDGYSSPVDKWIELEKRKCHVNYMRPFLIYYDDDVCGTVNVAIQKHIIRLKNIVVHPSFRRLGIGRSTSSLFSGIAARHGKAYAGCFALADKPSLAMYQQAGFMPVCYQTEWSKELFPPSTSCKNI